MFVGGMMLLSFALALSPPLPEAMSLLVASAIVFTSVLIAVGNRWTPAVLSTAMFMITVSLLDLAAIDPLSNQLRVESVKFALYAVALIPVAVASFLVFRDIALSRGDLRAAVPPLVVIVLAGGAWVSAYMLGRFQPEFGLSGGYVGEAMVSSSLLLYPILLLESALVSGLLMRFGPKRAALSSPSASG